MCETAENILPFAVCVVLACVQLQSFINLVQWKRRLWHDLTFSGLMKADFLL